MALDLNKDIHLFGKKNQQTQANNNPNQPQNNQNSSVSYDAKGNVERPVKHWKYIFLNDLNKRETGTLDAESEIEVRNFLAQQEVRIISVMERSAADVDLNIGGISAQDLSFSLTQLSTYLKAGIPLAEAIRILSKQTTKKVLKKSFVQLNFELLQGLNLSDALAKQKKYYPSLLINMVKTAEMTGDLPTILDDMAEYYTSIDQTRKQMKSAMTYPIVVLVIAFAVLIFMLTYLVPQFTGMFKDNGADLPELTKFIVNTSDFIKGNWWILLLAITSLVVLFVMLYKKVQPFRKNVQIALMHIPVIKNVIIYNEIANFTKTFASLLNHGVYITDSMDILKKITNNEVYKELINNCLVNLARGDTVSSAFKGKWAFPIVAYEMIVTGERTGQLGAMMEKVAGHFQMLHKNIIDQMKSLVEPILIVFLAVVVGIILVSIIQPMFAMYDTIK